MGPEPRDAAQWAADLAMPVDPQLGPVLRVLSNRGEHAVCLLIGQDALPYLPWIRDGLSMSSKLVVLLRPEDGPWEALLQQQLDRDIRLAVHRQELADFATDVADHRVDLVIGTELPVSMLKQSALAILMAATEVPDGFFGAPIGDSALLATQTGIQHGRTRRPRD